ncbi:MAG: D-amino acid aminotransferase [Gammaproteobacteria bacterium]|nr:D-amino acid aminotransferase [Gammaproteobacteria bacterium]
MTTVYLNGTFEPQDQARVSIMDRGFLFGDGVYEVIPAYGGRLFRLEPHLDRLQNSLDGIRLGNPLTRAAWREVLEELLRRNRDPDDPRDDQSLYLQVTRGVAPKRDHAFPVPEQATVLAMSSPIPAPSPELARIGVSAIRLPDNRWQHCHLKTITLLANVLSRQQALDAGAGEAILVRDGLANEGAASNLFLVSDGVLRTPPKSAKLLPGITRDLVLELAGRHGIPCREEDIPAADLDTADEVWLTSSTREILPVTKLDGKAVRDGKPGPLWQRMTRLYQDYKDAVRAGTAA